MPGDETLQHREDDSDSEDEEEDEIEQIPVIEIDPTTLTPLSPEVISKQVRSQYYLLSSGN
jgi:translation initiation factor 2 subunit 3